MKKKNVIMGIDFTNKQKLKISICHPTNAIFVFGGKVNDY
jgi:hypothetical protein